MGTPVTVAAAAVRRQKPRAAPHLGDAAEQHRSPSKGARPRCRPPYNPPHVSLADSMTPALAVLVVLALAAFGATGAVAGALWMKARNAAALRRVTEEHVRLLSLA